MRVFINVKGRTNFQTIFIPEKKVEILKKAKAIQGENLEVPSDEIYQAYLKAFGGNK